MKKLFNEKINVIIAGGGTGGHIYPAIAVAKEIKKRNKDSNILFLGSIGRMEMNIVPKHNFNIKGLWISGIKRTSFLSNFLFLGMSFLLKNFLFPIKLISSIIRSLVIINSFKPDLVLGFGGYVSGPILIAALLNKVPSAIQEQNSFPGITNRYLGNRVNLVFVAFNNMRKYFHNNMFCYGNPVRSDLLNITHLKKDAYNFFGLDSEKKTILIIGGSLGAKTINDSVLLNLSLIKNSSFQILWQTGQNYYEEIMLVKNSFSNNIQTIPYINEMKYAYACSDIVISRAGALAISELCVVGKAVIFVPSPNVVEDHQTKNALSLKSINACEIVKDISAKKDLIKTAFNILHDKKKMYLLEKNISSLAKPNATKKIVNKLISLKEQ